MNKSMYKTKYYWAERKTELIDLKAYSILYYYRKKLIDQLLQAAVFGFQRQETTTRCGQKITSAIRGTVNVNDLVRKYIKPSSKIVREL